MLTLTIKFDDLKECENMMICLGPDYHTVKSSSKGFQLQFPARHKKLLKTNENQSIITKKINPIFRKKSHHRSRQDPNRHQGLSG